MLQSAYSNLLHTLQQYYSVQQRDIGGYQFLYVQSDKHPDIIKQHIVEISRELCKNKSIQFECTFVRKQTNQCVYRIRFLVPSEKMFCCGNGCVDCTLLQ